MIGWPYRRILLPLLGAAVGWLTLIEPPDLYRFGRLGDQLLHGHLAVVYADKWNQAGPLQLVLARLLMLGASEATPVRLVAVLIDAGLVLAAMLLCSHRQTELLAGLSVLLWIGLQQPWNGHPVELLIPLGWVLALRLHRSGRWIRAALVLAGTVAIAPWAVLALPCLLAVAAPRPAVRTALVAIALGVSAYLPFVLTGHFAMFSHAWPVDGDSAVHLLLPSLSRAGWPVRLVQGVFTGGGCAWIAWKSRGTRLVLIAGPLAAALIRIVTDPVTFNYYWLSVAVLAVLAITQLPRPETPGRWIALVALVYLPWAMAAGGSSLLGRQFLGALVCLAVLATFLRPRPVAIRDDAGHGVPAHA